MVEKDETNGKVSEEEFLSILKIISPGTHFRTALGGVLKIGKGALIVMHNNSLFPLMDGGFRINTKFTSQKIMELSKMDGAIILSNDLKRIEYANVLLTPDNSIKSEETGTRHKAAERTAKQIGSLVIAVSERRNEVTLFYKNMRYLLRATEEVMGKVNQYIQILEKQRELFDIAVNKLTKTELLLSPSLSRAIQVIQKGRSIQKISDELRRPLIELGNEGTVLRARLKELISSVERETNLVIKDYTNTTVKKSKLFLEGFSHDDLLEKEKVLNALAYKEFPQKVSINGWRILSKTSLGDSEIAEVIKKIGISNILFADAGTYKKILGEEKSGEFHKELEILKMTY